MNANHTPPRQPSAEQWHAVRTALEKFTGRGRWSCFTGFTLPEALVISWDREGFPYDKAAGLTALFPDHAEICLRTDQTPEALHTTCLHELTHCFHAPLIRAGAVSRQWLELQARNTAERLAALP
jgi:hypothetical protein